MSGCRNRPALFSVLDTASGIMYNLQVNNINKTGSPIDRKPFTAEGPPIGKIHPFSKMAKTLEPVISKKFNLVYFMTESTIFNHKDVAATQKYFHKGSMTQSVT